MDILIYILIGLISLILLILIIDRKSVKSIKFRTPFFDFNTEHYESKTIKENEISMTNINQNHSGSGDNIAGNKIVVDSLQRVMSDDVKSSLLNEIQNLLSEKHRKVNVGVINGADGETLHLYNEVKSFLINSNIEIVDGVTTFHPSIQFLA